MNFTGWGEIFSTRVFLFSGWGGGERVLPKHSGPPQAENFWGESFKPRARVNFPKIYQVSGKFTINFFQIFLEDFFSSFVSKNITKKLLSILILRNKFSQKNSHFLLFSQLWKEIKWKNIKIMKEFVFDMKSKFELKLLLIKMCIFLIFCELFAHK